MTGITSIGAYVPLYRLHGEEIGRMWRSRAGAAQKAVAGYDEDAVTMAVAAARECIERSGKQADALFLATTSGPYREKQQAAIVAAALDLTRTAHTADFTNSLRSGTIALRAAIDSVRAGSAEQVLMTASDCRMGAPRGKFEQLLGDGAAALMVGSSDVIAEIESTYSVFSDFTDLWRTETDVFLRAGESRFTEEVGYLPAMEEAISGLLKKNGCGPGDFASIVFYAPDERQHRTLSKKLGFGAAQVQEPLYGGIGNTGTAALPIMLVAALERANPGERILVAGYGDGADAFVLRVTEEIGKMRRVPLLEEKLNRKREIDYASYLTWRDLVPLEASSLPERGEPSLAARWRERRTVSSLYGVKCRKCGTPQMHPIGQNVRICIACQAKDQFDPYRFSDKRGKLFTYAIDELQPTKNPPGLNGVIDFDGGGRLICELTDYELPAVRIGMPVEMTFRRLSSGRGMVNYFWKAKPVWEH